MSSGLSRESLAKVFENFDLDKNGFICKDELGKL